MQMIFPQKYLNFYYAFLFNSNQKSNNVRTMVSLEDQSNQVNEVFSKHSRFQKIQIDNLFGDIENMFDALGSCIFTFSCYHQAQM